jgi:hypothetical protein
MSWEMALAFSMLVMGSRLWLYLELAGANLSYDEMRLPSFFPMSFSHERLS